MIVTHYSTRRKFLLVLLMQNITVCSLGPSLRALIFPLGGGLQSNLHLRERTEAFGAFSASRIDTE